MPEATRPDMSQGQWCLAAVLAGAAQASPEAHLVLDPIREIGDDERNSLLDSLRLIDELTINSPYFALKAAFDRWVMTFHGAQEVLEETGRLGDGVVTHDVPAAVEGTLAAFRAFIDHTEHWLAGRFGDESMEMQAFRDQQKAEYDGHLEYRLAVNLRNTAQHQEPVVAVLTSNTEVAPGNVTDHLRVQMRGNLSTKKWNAAVRTEVSGLTEPIDMVQVLNQVMQCGERLFARVLLLTERISKPAVDEVLSVAAEVRAAVGTEDCAPTLARTEMSTRRDGSIFGQIHQMEILPYRAANLTENIAAVRDWFD